MLRSFRYAFQGILVLIRSENNARFHLLASILVVLLGYYVSLSTTEWAIILTQIGLVWSAEAMNTAIEKICNFVSPEHHKTIGEIKDLAAAGVVVVALVAVAVAGCIFVPKVI